MNNDIIITLKELLKKREIELDCVLDTATLYRLSEEFGLKQIESLEANFKLIPIAQQKGIALTATLRALVIHHCVVTLGPVPQSVYEKISIRYTPSGEDDILDRFIVTGTSQMPSADINNNYDVEPLENGQVNLYDVIREHLSLALYTNPRVANAKFDGYTVGHLKSDELKHIQRNAEKVAQGQQPVSSNPFSQLAALKQSME